MYSARRVAGAFLLSAGFLVAVAPSAGAEPGCPAAWTLWSVKSLAEQGNAPVPGFVDAAGNGDGYVCAIPLPDAVCIRYIVTLGLPACPVGQLYQYLDNRLPV